MDHTVEHLDLVEKCVGSYYATLVDALSSSNPMPETKELEKLKRQKVLAEEVLILMHNLKKEIELKELP